MYALIVKPLGSEAWALHKTVKNLSTAKALLLALADSGIVEDQVCFSAPSRSEARKIVQALQSGNPLSRERRLRKVHFTKS